MNIQGKTQNTSITVTTSFVIVSLLACLLCVALLTVGTMSDDGVLHQLMSYWFGPYVIITASFSTTSFIAALFGVDLKLKDKSLVAGHPSEKNI